MVISSVLDCKSVAMLTVDILNTICDRDCFADCSLGLTLIVSFWKIALPGICVSLKANNNMTILKLNSLAIWHTMFKWMSVCSL